jgi:hypothetical protein
MVMAMKADVICIGVFRVAIVPVFVMRLLLDFVVSRRRCGRREARNCITQGTDALLKHRSWPWLTTILRLANATVTSETPGIRRTAVSIFVEQLAQSIPSTVYRVVFVVSVAIARSLKLPDQTLTSSSG